MSDPVAHAKLLLAILGERWPEAAALTAPGPPDPEGFLETCRESDVSGWVHAVLERNERFDLIGDESARRLTAVRGKILRDNILLIARAELALATLADVGIVPVALKGLDLLHRVYDRIDLRTLTDVDLLVRRSELETCLAALEGAGWKPPAEPRRTHYIRTSHHLPLTAPGPIGVEFEVHWNLAQEMRFHIDVDGLFRRALPLTVDSHEARRLSDDDFVAHLLLHHFTHYFDRSAKWAIDLQQLLARGDVRWERVAARLGEWGATVASGMAVRHLRKLFPDWIPAEAQRLLPVATWRRLACLPLESRHPLELFRGTRGRRTQLYLAAVLLERPSLLPRWLMHRQTRGRRTGDNPLDTGRKNVG